MRNKRVKQDKLNKKWKQQTILYKKKKCLKQKKKKVNYITQTNKRMKRENKRGREIV